MDDRSRRTDHRQRSPTPSNFNTMDAETLLAEFQSFVNDDAQFRQFVKFCAEFGQRSNRLRYWQEQTWNAFIQFAPHHESLTVDSVLEQFFVCHVHLTPLQVVTYHIDKKWIITTVGNGTGPTPYSYRHPFAEEESQHTQPILVIHCDECLRMMDEQIPSVG